MKTLIEQLEPRTLFSAAVYRELAEYPGVQQHYQRAHLTPANGEDFLSAVQHDGGEELTVTFLEPTYSIYPRLHIRDHFYLRPAQNGAEWVFGSEIISAG